MSCVTLLLTGVPHFVNLQDLSYYLDQLFNTDEIATFKLRDLPNHPQTKKRQIALDFRYGFDAMAAQEKLDGYTYVMENGREYTLHAKINKTEEYKPSGLWSPEYSSSSQWYSDRWKALAIVPEMSDRDINIANARLDARLKLLKKCKLVQDKEKEILEENQRLRRRYGSAIVRPFYDDPVLDWTLQKTYNDCEERDTVTERSPSSPKISRSQSRERSVTRRQRSRSREPRSHESRPRDRGYTLPQIEWHERLSRERRSCSRDSRERRHSSTRHNMYRERRSRSSERTHRKRRPTSNERVNRARSRSEERTARSRVLRSWSKEERSKSREERSRSRERRARSGERRSRSRDRRSRSRDVGRRSREPITSRERRSESRERKQHRRSKWHRDSRSRERTPLYSPRRQSLMLMSPEVDRKTNRQALLYRHKSKSHRKRSPTDNVDPIDIKKKVIKVENDENLHIKKDAQTKEKTDSDLEKKQRDKEKKKMDKYNSKLRKAEKLESRVKELSKDVMILLAIMLDEIVDKDKINISTSNKVNMIKELEAIVQGRLEPIVKIKKYTDIGVMKSYRAKYPVEDDLIVIKRMLEKIPRIEVIEPQATFLAPSKCEVESPVSEEIWDVNSATQQECTNTTQIENAPVEIIENIPIKQEPKEEPIIIDIDSSDKPIPRHPQFVVVINTIIKNMNKTIRANNLGEQIKFAELKHVLRHILRNMLKNEGYLSRDEIKRRFRAKYPVEDDEQFVRNTIKDIKDGKYPGLTGHIADATENEAPDDVVVVEKHYDVITVADSDDDEVDKKLKMEIIHLDNELSQDKLNLTNISPDNPDTTPGPGNIAQNIDAINIIETKPCPDFSQDIIVVGPSASKDVTGSAYNGINNTSVLNTGSAETDTTNTGFIGTSKTNTGTANINQTMTSLASGETKANLANTTVCQANIGLQVPVNLPEKEAKQTANLDTLIQNLENSKVNTTDGVVSTRLKKKKKKKHRKRAGKEIQETADKTSKSSDFNEIKNNKNINEENDNNLKVTAITICTSIEELIAKTTNAKKPDEEKAVEEIKEEVEFEEDAQLDESSLHIDSVPRVTSITIMTSDAELLSLGNEEHRNKVDDIKNETEVFYDAEDNVEDNLFKDIEKAFNDVNFSNSIIKPEVEQNNSTNLQQTAYVERSIDLVQLSSKSSSTQESKTVEDDEESIESIVKYVASLY